MARLHHARTEIRSCKTAQSRQTSKITREIAKNRHQGIKTFNLLKNLKSAFEEIQEQSTAKKIKQLYVAKLYPEAPAMQQ